MDHLMGEGFTEVYTFLYENILYFWLHSSRYEKDFCQCYPNYLRHLWLKFFIFQWSGRWFPWHSKGGCILPHKSRGVFSDILGTASRLDAFHGLETWWVQSSRHVWCKLFPMMSLKYLIGLSITNVSKLFLNQAQIFYLSFNSKRQ